MTSATEAEQALQDGVWQWAGIPEEPILEDADEPIDWTLPTERAIPYERLLRKYAVTRQDVQAWSDYFLRNSGRRPLMKDVLDTRIPWLWERFQAYTMCRYQIIRAIEDHPCKLQAYVAVMKGFHGYRAEDAGPAQHKEAPDGDFFFDGRFFDISQAVLDATTSPAACGAHGATTLEQSKVGEEVTKRAKGAQGGKGAATVHA